MGINDVNCTICAKSLVRGQDAFTHSGQTYCRLCLCGSCAQPITGKKSYCYEEEVNYCHECCCGRCENPLLSSYVPGDNGTKICLSCCCEGCKFPFQADEHPPLCNKCKLTCSTCGGPLGQKYFKGEGKLFCYSCGSSENNQRDDENNNIIQSNNSSFNQPSNVSSSHSSHSSSQSSRAVDPIPHNNNHNNNNFNAPLSSNNPNRVPSENECGICFQLMDGRTVQCGAGRYHRTCFVCQLCRADATRTIDLKPYCDNCHPDNDVCSVCFRELTGGGLEALGRFFHDDCFACENCFAVINGLKFKELGGKVLCHTCAADESVIIRFQPNK